LYDLEAVFFMVTKKCPNKVKLVYFPVFGDLPGPHTHTYINVPMFYRRNSIE